MECIGAGLLEFLPGYIFKLQCPYGCADSCFHVFGNRGHQLMGDRSKQLSDLLGHADNLSLQPLKDAIDAIDAARHKPAEQTSLDEGSIDLLNVSADESQTCLRR